jgi:hypothetical protein
MAESIGAMSVPATTRRIGDGLRSRLDKRQETQLNVAVHLLNRMLEQGRPSYVRIV